MEGWVKSVEKGYRCFMEWSRCAMSTILGIRENNQRKLIKICSLVRQCHTGYSFKDNLDATVNEPPHALKNARISFSVRPNACLKCMVVKGPIH